jgi:hypothetical protein
LVSTIGLAQVDGENQFSPPLVTAGNEITGIARFLRPGTNSYSAAEVVRHLLGQIVSV